MSLDAYDSLFKMINKQEFFEKSINEIIYVDVDKIEIQWNDLKNSLINNEEIFIRGYGRDAKKTEYFIEFYKHLFNNFNIKKDSTNNAQPTKLLALLTDYAKVNTGVFKNKNTIVNYQISHLFAKTKNPLLFTSSWNIAYIPKYLDPFTGHESQGTNSDDFKSVFYPRIKGKFDFFIKDYNKFILSYEDKFDAAFMLTKKKFRLTKEEFKRFEIDCRNELSTINY